MARSNMCSLNSQNGATMIVRLHSELYMALCDREETKDLVEKNQKGGMVIQFNPSTNAEVDDYSFQPSS